MSRRKRQWMGYLVMVLGAMLLLGPYVLGELETMQQERVVAELHKKMAVTLAPATAEPEVTATAPVTPVPEVTEKPEAMVTEQGTPEPAAEVTAEPVTEPEPTAAPEGTPEPVFTPEPADPFFQAALAYNRKLVEEGQDAMRNRSDLERFELKAKDYGYSDEIIGTVNIPRIGVEVPLYLGTTSEHMAKGFAVFGMTSLPLGLGTENVAIAGHRGWHGAPFLRDVQMILIGDPVYVTTPWNTLTYKVTGIQIVTPQNSNWCLLKPGKTMISLMTCHPYAQHTHRYVVQAELVTEPEETGEPEVTATPVPEATEEPAPAMTEAVTEAPAEETPVPSGTVETEVPTEAPTTVPTEEPTAVPAETPVADGRQIITWVNDDGTTEMILMDTGAVNPDDSEYKTDWSNTLILLEDSMRPVAYAVSAVVLLVGIWLTIVTIRDKRKK